MRLQTAMAGRGLCVDLRRHWLYSNPDTSLRAKLFITHIRYNGVLSMSSFDKREEGFEKKFAHDEELRFKANARRNKLLGLWAAEKLGITGPAADAYAKDVVMSDFEEAGDHDVFRKIRKDFDDKGITQSDAEIRHMMDDLMGKAIEQIRVG